VVAFNAKKADFEKNKSTSAKDDFAQCKLDIENDVKRLETRRQEILASLAGHRKELENLGKNVVDKLTPGQDTIDAYKATLDKVEKEAKETKIVASNRFTRQRDGVMSKEEWKKNTAVNVARTL